MFVSGRWPRPRLGRKLGWSWRNAEESFQQTIAYVCPFFSTSICKKMCIT